MFKQLLRIGAVIGLIVAVLLPVIPVSAAVPTFSDLGVSSVSSTSVSFEAYVSGTGGLTTDCYVLITGGGITNISSTGIPSNVFVGRGGLSPNTTYAYQWFVGNTDGYAPVVGGYFTTLIGTPLVYVWGADDPTATGAVINGTVEDDGGEACQVEFAWDTVSHANFADYGHYSGWYGAYNTGDNYDYTLSGLASSTTYYYRTEALNSYGASAQSSEQSFATTAIASTLLTIGAASSIAATVATFNGTINSELSLLSTQWAWGTTSQSTFAGYTNHSDGGTFTGSYSAGAVSFNATGLTTSTLYYYRFETKDTSNNIVMSGESSFNTKGYAFVTLTGATSVTGTTATLNGTLTNDGGYPGGVSIEFAYGTTSYASASYASYTDHVALAGAFSTSNALNKAISSLTASTTYYFMIRASNAIGYSYSSIGTFSTLGLPIISSVAASNIAKTTARLNSNLISDGSVPCTITFGYGTVSHTAVAFGSYTTKTAVTGTFTIGSAPYLDISGLASGTAYYFRVQAVNSVGTVVSTSEQTFTTLVNVNEPTNLLGVPTDITIQLTWTLGTGASGTLVRMSTTAYPTTTSDGVSVYNGTSGAFKVLNLTAGTTYYFSAWGYSGATYSASYTTKLVTTQAAGIPGASNTSTGTAVQIPNVARWIGSPNYQTLENVPLLYPAVNGAADSLQMPREIAWAVLAFLTALITGIAVYFKSHSALGGVIAGAFVSGLWYVVQIMPLFYIILYVVVGALLIRGGKEMDG